MHASRQITIPASAGGTALAAWVLPLGDRGALCLLEQPEGTDGAEHGYRAQGGHHGGDDPGSGPRPAGPELDADRGPPNSAATPAAIKAS
jgi:hypothetical protein